MQDDGEANVEDEVDSANNPANDEKSPLFIEKLVVYTRYDESNGEEGKEEILESKIYSNQFVILHSNSMNFQAGKDKIDYCNNHGDDEVGELIIISRWWW